MKRPGSLVNPLDVFRDGTGLEPNQDIDVDWFVQIPNRSVARARLDFLRTPGNIFDLMKNGYGGQPLDRMWKAVYRACIGFGEPLPDYLDHHAESLGVIVP